MKMNLKFFSTNIVFNYIFMSTKWWKKGKMTRACLSTLHCQSKIFLHKLGIQISKNKVSELKFFALKKFVEKMLFPMLYIFLPSFESERNNNNNNNRGNGNSTQIVSQSVSKRFSIHKRQQAMFGNGGF